MQLVVVVTGANRGIGLEFCKQYLSAGAKVFALCRQVDSATKLSELVGKNSNNLIILEADVTSRKQVKAAFIEISCIIQCKVPTNSSPWYPLIPVQSIQ